MDHANIREKEALQKLNVVTLDLEKSRKIIDQCSEQLEVVPIAKLTIEADLKKLKEGAEYWKNDVVVMTSHNGEMSGNIAKLTSYSSMSSYILIQHIGSRCRRLVSIIRLIIIPIVDKTPSAIKIYNLIKLRPSQEKENVLEPNIEPSSNFMLG